MIEQVISGPQKAILKSTKSLNLFLGGVGSGKTFLGGIISYRYVRRYPTARGFIGANTYLQLTQSTVFRVREYWKSIGVTEYEKNSNPNGLYVVNKKPPAHFDTSGHNFDEYYGIISFINGAVIFTGSLDHAEAHYGKELAWAILDETKDSDETDVKEVILSRLRQRGMYIKDGELADKGDNFNPAYFLTSPAKAEWLNKLFNLDDYIDEINQSIYSATTYFQKEVGDRFVVISSTYHNEHNLPSNYIEGIKERNTEERAKAMIYANPFSVVGGEYYSSFSRLKHVEHLKYDPLKPVHVTFDQNTVPYNSASIWQIERKEDVWYCCCIDEIALENPRNSTEEVCEEFIRRYPAHKAGLFYYGDASGKNRSTMSKEFKHHYQIVEYKLKKYLSGSADRTAHRNPPVVKRRDFINKIFEEKLPIRIIFDERCKYMIGDMLYCRQAPDGLKDKKIVTNKETGEKYQERGHLSDGMEYFITQAFINYFQA